MQNEIVSIASHDEIKTFESQLTRPQWTISLKNLNQMKFKSNTYNSSMVPNDMK